MPEPYHVKWWRENKHKYRESRKEYEREYLKNNLDRKLLNTCKSRAKKCGIAFNLEVSDIEIPEICPILGKPLVRCTMYAPSIDRIKPELGYIKGNVQVISRLANVMKNNASEEDLRSFSEWVLKTYKI